MLTLPITSYNESDYSLGLAVLQRQGQFTPKANTITVLFNESTGNLSTMPKGLQAMAPTQLRVITYTLQELEDIAQTNNSEDLMAALLLIRPRMDESNRGFYLFADSPNHIVIAPAPRLPKRAPKGFA